MLKETQQEIANTILNQLGGSNRLSVMIGAKYFSHDENGSLTFKFSLCKKANHVKISLNPLDLYDIKFYKITGKKFEVVKEIVGIYEDQLKIVIENFTDLNLSL